MATRCYLPSSGAAAVSPAFDASWTDTSGADRIGLQLTKIASAMTTKSVTTGLDVAGAVQRLARQYVGPPMQAQTISGTVKGQLRALESGASVNYDGCYVALYVVSNDGSTVRGALLDFGDYDANGGVTEFSTSLKNREFIAAGSEILTLAVSDGDRIVLEVGGANEINNSLLAGSFGFSFGDDSGTDLPENTTETNAYNAWIEFSQTILVQNQSSAPGSITLAETVNDGTIAAGARNVTPATIDLAETVNPGTVSATGREVTAAAIALVETVNDGTIMSGAQNVAAESIALVATVNAPLSADVVIDSYDPTAIVTSGPPTPLRPTTPSTLGDQDYGTGEDSGDIVAIAPLSGTNTQKATVIQDGFDDGQGISYLRAWGVVEVTDVAPIGYTYKAPDTCQFHLKLGATSALWAIRETYPAQGNTGVLSSVDITTKPGGGAWTWADVNALAELGVQIAFALAAGEFTRFKLLELWLEVYEVLGADVPPIAITQDGGAITKRLRVRTRL